jgi:hypothetical protein
MALAKESEELAYDTMNNVRRAAKQIDEFWGPLFRLKLELTHSLSGMHGGKKLTLTFKWKTPLSTCETFAITWRKRL